MMRCLLEQTGSWYQVHTCLSYQNSCVVGTVYDPPVFMVTCTLNTCVCIVVYSVYCVLEYVSLCTSGLAVSQLILSSRTVWVRCVNGDLARRYGVSDRNPAGDYWKKIPGNANWLTGETGVILVRLGVSDCCYCSERANMYYGKNMYRMSVFTVQMLSERRLL